MEIADFAHRIAVGSPSPQAAKAAAAPNPPSDVMRWTHSVSDSFRTTADRLKKSSLNWAQRALDAITPAPPPYEPLTARDRADLVSAQPGTTVPLQPITDQAGRGHEPVNIEVVGQEQQLEDALESQGWKLGFTDGQRPDVLGFIAHGNAAGLVPFSHQNVVDEHGQSVGPAFVMSKDSCGLNRHHLRVYQLGNDRGQPLWGIASSRDNHPTPELNHVSDPHVDPERDTVLHDLLQSQRALGQNVSVSVLNGQPQNGTAVPIGAGQYNVNDGEYFSDLKVYQLQLTARR
jgi:hypothetical protein